MKKVFAILLSVIVASGAGSQVVFRTVVPQHPITVGESFQVQYIIEEGVEVDNFMAPLFSQFRLVTGPNIYHGTTISLGQPRQVRNMVYTLEATKTGKYTIPGAAATVNGKLLRSQDQQVIVITAAEAMLRYERDKGINADYILRPGEDPIQKIRKNLFLKVQVDRKSCYTGEPVVATFKLYSRLESRSDIVKNPGFYGFTVHDVINLADRHVTTESIDGRNFDVHTIRKVELFPLQAGRYTIDPMEVKNIVEFSRSAVYRKTEQEIVEGINIDPPAKPDEHAAVYETEMRTEPFTIDVKPLPFPGKPANFDGAVGKFSVAAILSGDKIARNQEGFLELRITGSGNLIQVSAPPVTWPQGIEGFEPVLVSESGDATSASKTFRYAFVSSKTGEYEIPSIDFSFFNPDTGIYKTTKTGSLHVKITNEAPVNNYSVVRKVTRERKSSLILPIVIITLAGIGFFAAYRFIGLKKNKPAPVETPVVLPADPGKLLQPAYAQLNVSDETFYAALRAGVFDFFREEEGLSGSEMRKDLLPAIMTTRGIDSHSIETLTRILEQCETGMYTGVISSMDKKEMLDQAKEILTRFAANSL